MRILFIGHSKLHTVRGGDRIQYLETARALRNLGQQVDEIIVDQFDPKIHNNYDIFHWFNMQWVPLDLIQKVNSTARKHNIKIAMSTIYSDDTESLWATYCIMAFFNNSNPSQEDKDKFYTSLSQKNLTLSLSDRNLTYSRYTNVYKDERGAFFRYCFDQADILLPNSLTEAQNIQHSLDLPNKLFKPVTNAVNLQNFTDTSNSDEVGDEPFVLSVARVDRHKNISMIAEAINKLNYKWVLIGSQPDEDYLKLVKSIAPKKTVIIKELAQSKLAAYYKKARVHVNASYSETCCLSALEAASIGDCNLVMGNRGSEISYYKEHAYYCDPLSLNSITEAIRLAYTNHDKDQARRDKLKELIQTEYTWENAARQTLEAYEMVKR